MIDQSERRAIQPFSLEGIKAELGIHPVENPSHKNVFEQFGRASKKLNLDLRQGFCAWVTDGDLGHCAAYNRSENAKFVLLETLIGGVPVRIHLNGIYAFSGHEISVTVDREAKSPFVSSNVFLDNCLVASRTSPFDEAGQQAAAFLRSLVESRSEDPSRLDTTITPQRSPYPFATKMIEDFLNSQPDKDETERMMQKMQDSTVVCRVSEYQLK